MRMRNSIERISGLYYKEVDHAATENVTYITRNSTKMMSNVTRNYSY